MEIGLSLSKFEVFVKVLKFVDIIDIVAAGEKDVRISVQKSQVSDVPAQPKFSSDHFVFLEVVHVLLL